MTTAEKIRWHVFASSWAYVVVCVLALILLGLMMFGCASAPPRPVSQQVATVDVPATIGRFGINDGYHGPIPADIVAHYCDYTRSVAVNTVPPPPLVELRVPVLSVAQADAVLASIAPCLSHTQIVGQPLIIAPLLSLDILIERDDLTLASAIGAWATTHPDFVDAIECGNELDITGLTRNGVVGTLDAEQFATWVFACNQAVRAAGFGLSVVSGGVYALTDDTWAYLQPTIKVCRMVGCAIGIHDYDNVEAVWMDRLAALGLDVWITETGAHSANATEDAGQAAFLRDMCAGLSRARVKRLIVYQRPSGPGNTNLDRFGLQRFDGTWKPGDAALARMIAGSC